MKRPEFLKSGDTIAISAPSFGATIEPYKTRLDFAVKKFEKMGFNVVIGDNVHKSDGIGISTNPQDAADELVDFYLNSDVDAIFSSGGGELMCQTVSRIDFEKLKGAKPKWFMGYSDNTNFIIPLVTKCDTMAIYGQCATTFGQEWHKSFDDHFNLLTGKSNYTVGYDSFESPSAHNSGDALGGFILDTPKELVLYNTDCNGEITAEGTLIGGCLDVINNLCGTNLEDVKGFMNRHEKLIWCLEACEYNVMDLERSLWHLDQCGWFTNASAFVIGRPLSAWKQSFMGLDQYTAVLDILQKYDVPIIMNADIGHIDPMVPLVMGADAVVKAHHNNWSVEYK